MMWRVFEVRGGRRHQVLCYRPSAETLASIPCTLYMGRPCDIQANHHLIAKKKRNQICSLPSVIVDMILKQRPSRGWEGGNNYPSSPRNQSKTPSLTPRHHMPRNENVVSTTSSSYPTPTKFLLFPPTYNLTHRTSTEPLRPHHIPSHLSQKTEESKKKSHPLPSHRRPHVHDLSRHSPRPDSMIGSVYIRTAPHRTAPSLKECHSCRIYLSSP